MKKKFLGLMAIVVIAVVAALNVNLGAQEEVLSSVTLENVEALAGGEINPECPNGCLAQCGSGCYCNGWHELYLEATWN